MCFKGSYRRSGRGIMRTNTAIVFAWALLLVAFATSCSYRNAEASGESDKDQARLEIKGSPGEDFSGSCSRGKEEPGKMGGIFPKSITNNLRERSLDGKISSEGDLQ